LTRHKRCRCTPKFRASDYLGREKIGLASHFVSDRDTNISELLLALVYGDPNTPRSIPLEFALSQGLYPSEVAKIRQTNEEFLMREREEFIEEYFHRKNSLWTPKERDKPRFGLEYDKMNAQREKIYDLGMKRKPRTGHLRMSDQVFTIVDHLEPRAFPINERVKVIEACIKELSMKGGSIDGMMAALEACSEVCLLLAKPENHVKVASGQYVEKQVHVRQVHDMTDEAAQDLINLPRYMAYAKIIEEKDGKQTVWSGKIETYGLPKETPYAEEDLAKSIHNGHINSVKRADIEEAIRQRQEKWRQTEQTTPSEPPEEPQAPPTSF
jgi:hypothetical protein